MGLALAPPAKSGEAPATAAKVESNLLVATASTTLSTTAALVVTAGAGGPGTALFAGILGFTIPAIGKFCTFPSVGAEF